MALLRNMGIFIFFLRMVYFSNSFIVNKYLFKRDIRLNYNRRYQITREDYIEKIRRLNSKNTSIQNSSILDDENMEVNKTDIENIPRIRINIHKNNILQALGIKFENENSSDESEEINGDFEYNEETNRRTYVEKEKSKSKNFEVIKKYNINFSDVGGYDNVKTELEQCVDILKNYNKYMKYNIVVFIFYCIIKL